MRFKVQFRWVKNNVFKFWEKLSVGGSRISAADAKFTGNNFTARRLEKFRDHRGSLDGWGSVWLVWTVPACRVHPERSMSLLDSKAGIKTSPKPKEGSGCAGAGQGKSAQLPSSDQWGSWARQHSWNWDCGSVPVWGLRWPYQLHWELRAWVKAMRGCCGLAKYKKHRDAALCVLCFCLKTTEKVWATGYQLLRDQEIQILLWWILKNNKQTNIKNPQNLYIYMFIHIWYSKSIIHILIFHKHEPRDCCKRPGKIPNSTIFILLRPQTVISWVRTAKSAPTWKLGLRSSAHALHTHLQQAQQLGSTAQDPSPGKPQLSSTAVAQTQGFHGQGGIIAQEQGDLLKTACVKQKLLLSLAWCSQHWFLGVSAVFQNISALGPSPQCKT